MSGILMCRGWRRVLRGGEGEGSGFVVLRCASLCLLWAGVGIVCEHCRRLAWEGEGITCGKIDHGNMRELQASFWSRSDIYRLPDHHQSGF
jgi:hypothetical protein